MAVTAQAALAQAAKSFDVAVEASVFSDFEPRFAQKRDFGSLTFRGGAVFSAADRRFGGFSGMQVVAGGKRLLAVSDSGFWLAADIARGGAEAVAGLEKAHMAPLYSGMGPRAETRKFYSDAEALAVSGSNVYVAFEAINAISRYRLDLETLAMEPALLPLPPEIGALDVNKGMEALALAPAGTPLAGHLVAILERGATRSGPTPGWILNPEGASPLSGMFMVERDGFFDVTDAVFLKDGDLLILERRFTIADGVAMRLRRIEADAVKAGAVLRGTVILEGGLSNRIDNMEAMSVFENARGETVLALMSDDNHSLLQRTIYLEFIITGG